MKTLIATAAAALVIALGSPAFACSKSGSYRAPVAKVSAPAVSKPTAAPVATPAPALAPIETTSPAFDDASATTTLSEAQTSAN